MQLWYTRMFALAVAGALALTALATAQAQQGWGTIKGQVVFDGPNAPKRAPLKVDKDQNACLKNGPLLDDKLVVNPKNKGVRWAVVYLMDVKGFKNPIPIHPALQNIPKQVVEIDQPCCLFEPHVVALREGQTLVVKNSAGISHNVKIDPQPSLNQIVPPGKKLTLKDELKARNLPLQVACNIHGWMTGKIFVLPNPYFAVTDEDGNFEIKNVPAGAFRLVGWHEAQGWLLGDKAKPDKNGKTINIKAGQTTDLGKIPLKPSKD